MKYSAKVLCHAWFKISSQFQITKSCSNHALVLFLSKSTKLQICVVSDLYVDLFIYSYTKEKATQLVWRFKSLSEPSPAYPLGVCVEYRAYSRDEVTEIVQDNNPLNPVGLIAKRCLVQWQPVVAAHNNNTHVGMYIMHSLPRRFLMPAPFPAGSRSALDATL